MKNACFLRYLSRESILQIAGTGCPSTDRKVVNSGKRLRAYVGSNEENVCLSCAFDSELIFWSIVFLMAFVFNRSAVPAF